MPPPHAVLCPSERVGLEFATVRRGAPATGAMSLYRECLCFAAAHAPIKGLVDSEAFWRQDIEPLLPRIVGRAQSSGYWNAYLRIALQNVARAQLDHPEFLIPFTAQGAAKQSSRFDVGRWKGTRYEEVLREYLARQNIVPLLRCVLPWMTEVRVSGIRSMVSFQLDAVYRLVITSPHITRMEWAIRSLPLEGWETLWKYVQQRNEHRIELELDGCEVSMEALQMLPPQVNHIAFHSGRVHSPKQEQSVVNHPTLDSIAFSYQLCVSMSNAFDALQPMLGRLKRIHVNGNHLIDPQPLVCLVQHTADTLEVLYIDEDLPTRTALKQMDQEFQKMIRLKKLYLGCFIPFSSNSFQSLVSLTHLTLQSLRYSWEDGSSILRSIPCPSQLIRLCLSHCSWALEFSRCSVELLGLFSSLEHLDLSYCALWKDTNDSRDSSLLNLVETIANNAAILSLNLSMNRLGTFPFGIQMVCRILRECKMLVELRIQGCLFSIEDFCLMYTCLKKRPPHWPRLVLHLEENQFCANDVALHPRGFEEHVLRNCRFDKAKNQLVSDFVGETSWAEHVQVFGA